MIKKLNTVLCIGGSDCSGGAGIQADIKAVSSLGLHPLTVITAVTAQNSTGVKDIDLMPRSLIKSQLNAIKEDVIPDAIKIGMIGDLENGLEIVGFLESLPKEIPVVVDPVLKASKGGNLYKNEYESDINFKFMQFYRELLFPISTCVTPNIPEAMEFTGERLSGEITFDIMKKLLHFFKCKSLILKGGHSLYEDSTEITDILIYPNKEGEIELSEFKSSRIECENLHGTGCTYASLLASYLACGNGICDAFQKTSKKMNEIIKNSCGYEMGKATYGPLNIFDFKF